MILYHSTILARLPQIQKEGFVPGKETVLSLFIYTLFLEVGFPLHDSRYFYVWTRFDKAKECANATSTLADKKYEGEDRKPVVIEFETREKLFDFLRVKQDPQSSPFGVNIRGIQKQIKSIYLIK